MLCSMAARIIMLQLFLTAAAKVEFVLWLFFCAPCVFSQDCSKLALKIYFETI